MLIFILQIIRIITLMSAAAGWRSSGLPHGHLPVMLTPPLNDRPFDRTTQS